MSDTLKAVADKMVHNCKTQNETEGLATLYAADAVSVEMAPMPGERSAVTEGLEGIKGKHAWWDENFEVHNADVDGPYLHGDDSFAVIFGIDATEKASGQRWKMKEVAIYTLGGDGKIVKEAFYGTPM